MIICDQIFFDVEQARAHGFGVIRNLVSIDDSKEIISNLTSLIEDNNIDWILQNSVSDPSSKYIVIKSLDTPSNFFFRLARDPTIGRLIESYIGQKVTPLYVEYFDKPPMCECISPPHQDHAFYNSHFPDEIGITIWIALDCTTIYNGCMHMVPTNYLIKNLIEHKISDNIAFRYEIVNYNLNEYIPCELSPGDAIIFSSYTPHYCPANVTEFHRRAIAISYRTSPYRQQFSHI